MKSNTAAYIKLLGGKCTFREVVSARYGLGKEIGLGMYTATANTNQNSRHGENKDNFLDIYHNTIEKCLRNYDKDTVVLLLKEKGEYKPLEFDENKYVFESEEQVHALFFKALRINIIRQFQYSYNKLRSGKDVEDLLIPIQMDLSSHMDGFQMLENIKRHFKGHKLFGGDDKAGERARDIIWMILNGHSFKYVEDQLGIKGVAYKASIIQDYVKSFYSKDIAHNNGDINIDDYEYDEISGLWTKKKQAIILN